MKRRNNNGARERGKKYRRIEASTERQCTGRNWAWQSICVSTYSPTSESDNKRQRDTEKEAKSGCIFLPLNLVAHFIYGYFSLPRSSSSLCARGCFLASCPNDWVKQMKTMRFVVGVLFSCHHFFFLFLSFLLFLFGWHLEKGIFGPLRNCSSSKFPVCSSAHVGVCACTFVSLCPYISCFHATYFNMNGFK